MKLTIKALHATAVAVGSQRIVSPSKKIRPPATGAGGRTDARIHTFTFRNLPQPCGCPRATGRCWSSSAAAATDWSSVRGPAEPGPERSGQARPELRWEPRSPRNHRKDRRTWGRPRLPCNRLTQCSFVAGQTISLCTVRTRQRSQPSWQPGSQPLLQGSQALHAAADPPPLALQGSQPSQRSQIRVTPGMQMSLHLQQYL